MSPQPDLERARHLGRAIADLAAAITRAERAGHHARAIHALRLKARIFRWWTAELSEIERQGYFRQAVLLDAARICSAATDQDFPRALELTVLRRLSKIALPGESAKQVLDRYVLLRLGHGHKARTSTQERR